MDRGEQPTERLLVHERFVQREYNGMESEIRDQGEPEATSTLSTLKI